MAKTGENKTGPSYTSQQPEFYENKSLKRETKAMNGDGGSGAVSGARRVGKETRKTGKL